MRIPKANQEVTASQVSSKPAIALRWVRNGSFQLTQLFTKPTQLPIIRKKSPTCSFQRWKGKRRVEHISNISAFQGTAQRTGFCFIRLEVQRRNKRTLDAWGPQRTKENSELLQGQQFIIPQLHITGIKCPAYGFSLGRERESGIYVLHSSF